MPREDSKMVRKEKVEDDDDKSLASLAKRSKNVSNNAATKSQARVKKEENKVKKEEVDEDFEGTTPSNKSSGKKAAKKKVKEEEAQVQKTRKRGKADDGKEATKRERKVYDLPGQKRDPPEERDPLRIFYESLYGQVPDSEMAAVWMMESGLLPKEVAKKVFEKKQKKAQKQKLGSPMKTVATVKKKPDSVTIENKSVSSSVKTIQKKKAPASKKSKDRKGSDESSGDDSDDDFVQPARTSKKQRGAS